MNWEVRWHCAMCGMWVTPEPPFRKIVAKKPEYLLDHIYCETCNDFSSRVVAHPQWVVAAAEEERA